MSVLKNLVPDLVIGSIGDIDFDRLRKKGIKGLILDIDNTLVSASSRNPDVKASDWIKNALQKGFKLCIVSNAFKKRVTSIANALGVDFIYRASKPRRRSFLKAKSIMGLKTADIAVIGDQIFTDVFGGNRAGMYTILVNPIGPKEIFIIKPRRMLENIILSRIGIRRGYDNET